jgi:hypothetical protein
VVTKSRLPISAIKHAIVGVGGGVGFTSWIRREENIQRPPRDLYSNSQPCSHKSTSAIEVQ